MKHRKGPDPETVYLHPGELQVCEEPKRVVTVLGSCVSVTMFSPERRIGAICHGTLPRCRAQKACGKICIEAFKYMDCAVYYMLGVFKKLGIRNRDIEVKLFGGADTLISKSSNTIGANNVKTALGIIRTEGLRVTAADVGDSFGRKLFFYSHTGEVYLKRLTNGSAGKDRKSR